MFSKICLKIGSGVWLLVFSSLCSLPLDVAANSKQEAEAFVVLDGIAAAKCDARDGVMYVVYSSATEQVIEVHLDRYFQGMRQPGRSIVQLEPHSNPKPLGCSKVLMDGADQFWKIVAARFVGDENDN